MSRRVIKKLRNLGYTRDEIARATGIAPRTQTRIMNIRGYTKRVSRETQEKLSDIAVQYEEIKYKRSKVIDLDRFSSYRLFDAKIGEKRFTTIRESFLVDTLDTGDIKLFIMDQAPKTRFVSVRIGVFNDKGQNLISKSTSNFDLSLGRIEQLSNLADKTNELVDKALSESGQAMRYNYRTKEWEAVDEDEFENLEAEKVEIEIVGIVKGL